MLIEPDRDRTGIRLTTALVAVGLALAIAAPAHAASGSWERAWGKNVNGGGMFGICTVAASCLAGSAGGLGGEMDGASSVATDGAGNVYVADENANRIQKFDSAGSFELTWGKGVNMTTGGNLCTAASGNTCQAGTAGGLGGEMNLPTGVATDGAGNVYLADQTNRRIQKFADPISPPIPPSGGATAAAPSNAISFGKLRRNKNKGTAILLVTVPGAGTLSLSGKGVVKQRAASTYRAARVAGKTVASAGTVKLLVKPKGKTKRKLNRSGRAKVKAVVTYTPTGGPPATHTKRVKLIKKH